MRKIRWLKKAGMLVVGMAATLVLAACGGSTTGTTSTGTEPAAPVTEAKATETTTDKVKIVLNWFPKSQHGGVYAAQEKGVFKENGFDVTIEPGGPQVSAVQIVASGNADFGLAHADQLLIARNQGIELVAVAAALQGSPQAFMFHENAAIEKFEDLNGRTVFIQPGITYWDFLKKKYDLSGAKEIAYNGQHVNFMADLESVSQAFVTSEPFFLEAQGVKVKTKLVSESGYDPYNVVLFVTKDYLEKNKETVQRFVAAFASGWGLYKDASDEINEAIHKVNPNIALDALKFETEAQVDFVYGKDATAHGFGYMTEERWGTLIKQLVELGLLKEEIDPKAVFTTEFLPRH